MDAMNCTTVRKTLAKTLEQVCDDHDPVIITRKTGRPAVLVCLDDYQAMEETAYLLRTPANCQHLLESLKQADAGEAQERTLIECP